jgi:hypothetical protein
MTRHNAARPEGRARESVQARQPRRLQVIEREDEHDDEGDDEDYGEDDDHDEYLPSLSNPVSITVIY